VTSSAESLSPSSSTFLQFVLMNVRIEYEVKSRKGWCLIRLTFCFASASALPSFQRTGEKWKEKEITENESKRHRHKMSHKFLVGSQTSFSSF
jgi:hypothetical protein